MSSDLSTRLDCIVVGYNEPPFSEYESLVARYGKHSEAYRDLRFSFVDVDGQKLDYCGLLNLASRMADPSRKPSRDEEFKSGDIPNLAAAYLTHYLRRHFSVVYVNLFQEEKAKLARLLKENPPLCVALTTTFYVINLPVIEMVRFIRECNPTIKIIVGGPLIANHRRRLSPENLPCVLEELGADIYIIDSQGEATLSEVIRCLKAGLPIHSVPNLIVAERGRFQGTSAVPENNSLDECAIDWGQLADHRLGPTLQTRTARSCAFSCSFCAYPTRAGKLTLASLDSVERELDSMVALGEVRHVIFIDDTFNVPMKRFKELCRRMIARSYPFQWYSYFRCGNADQEAVELAAQSGCRGVFLGIESGSDVVLQKMNKAASAEAYRRGIGLLKAHGILTFASFIGGFPGETQGTFRETVDFIRTVQPDYYRIQLWYCEPGTPILEQRVPLGIEGSGFRWRHTTMESLTAMDLIEQSFFEIRESVWLPQWSFDFWIIPYLMGRGFSPARFREFMQAANELLALDLRGGNGENRREERAGAMESLAASVRNTQIGNS